MSNSVFNELDQEQMMPDLTIKPVENLEQKNDDIDLDELMKEFVDEKKQEDIFLTNKKRVKVSKEELAPTSSDFKEEEPVKKKRGRGKRGKDKKPRIRKPPSEKQLAHLARIRQKASDKRKKEREDRAARKVEEKRNIEMKVEPKTEKVSKPIAIPEKKQVSEEQEMSKFFKYMSAYEATKLAHQRRVEERKRKLLQQKQRRINAPKQNKKVNTSNIHPNRSIPSSLRPKPPSNPQSIWADCFA